MVHDNLQDLKKSALKFEEVVNESKGMDDLSHYSLDVFGESKSALDYSMALLREKGYPDAKKKIFYPYYARSEEEVIANFEKMNFNGIEVRHPEILTFIEEKNQPEWVKDFIATRNIKVGFLNQINGIKLFFYNFRHMKILAGRS